MTASRRSILTRAGIALAATFAVSTGASAQSASAINTLGGTHAINGYDPVAYFTSGGPRKGQPALAHQYGGATWLFASEANRALFVASPEKYLPAFGGFCAYGVSRGYLVKIDPNAWSIVDGVLYLNYDRSVRATWLKDASGHIATARTNWPKLTR